MRDEHATRLAEWLIRTTGRALGVGLLVGFGIAIIGGAIDPDVVPLAFVAGPLTFAGVLARADAPKPGAVETPGPDAP